MKLGTSSDLARMQMLQRQAFTTRARLDTAAVELTTGQKANRYEATGGNLTRLFALERALDRNTVFSDTLALSEMRLDIMQEAFGRVLGPVQDLSVDLNTAVGVGDLSAGRIHAQTARRAFSDTVGVLNTRVAGQGLFSGAATDRNAVAPAADILADLDALAAGAATAADAVTAIEAYFAPGGAFFATGYGGSVNDLAAVEIGDGTRLDYAVRGDADEVVSVLRAQALAAVVAGGAFAGDNAAQLELLGASGQRMLAAPHLIAAHPAGLILGYNRKTYGTKEWHALYNYPDMGYSFVYQNMNNGVLGDNYSLYAHFNFYFFRRNMQFRIGQGLAYNTNPYDKSLNFRNNAYGSHLMSSTFLMLNYHKENIFKGLGFNVGASIIHYSNANFKAPNTSTNTFALNAGLIYELDGGKTVDYLPLEKREKVMEPIRYNLAFRTGINESDVVGSGRYGFVVLSAYADKRLGRKSAVQLGTDLFFSNFLKELIRYQSISFPENGVSADDDYKRIGLFVGHELFINKLSIGTQLGYYVYYPFDFEGKLYNRLSLKRYFGTKIFGVVSLKSHGAAAEAVEFGVGIRL